MEATKDFRLREKNDDSLGKIFPFFFLLLFHIARELLARITRELDRLGLDVWLFQKP